MIRKNTSIYAKFISYLIVIVLINLVGLTVYFRVDLTGNKVYSLSPVSRQVVSTLSEPLTIYVFFTRDLPAPYNTVERYLRDLLSEYSLHANTFFNYRFFDVSAEGEAFADRTRENRRLANNYGIAPVQIQAIEKDEVKFKNAYMGLVIIHGDMLERIPTITSTDALEYKLTTAMQSLNNKISALLNLKEKVQVKLYLSSSLLQVSPHMGLNDMVRFPDEIATLVESLNSHMYRQIEYSHFDIDDEGEMQNLATEYNLMLLSWPDHEEAGVSAGSGIIGMLIEHDDTSFMIPLLQAYRVPLFGTRYALIGLEDLENAIEESVASLIGINETLGFLADHGTLSLYSAPGSQPGMSLSNFNTLASQRYTIREFDLSERGIPEGLGSLIIARPSETFSEYDLFQIDQALMRGTNLALFLDPFKELSQGATPYGQQQTVYLPFDSGLEKLLEHYGIRVMKSYTMDESSFRQRLPQQFGGGEQSLYFAPVIKSETINSDLGYLKNIRGLVTYRISPLELDEERIRENNLRATRLFSSSQRSWEMKGNINFNPMLQKVPTSDAEMQSFDLAYMIEGSFPSYFAGKPLPEKPSMDESIPSPQEGAQDLSEEKDPFIEGITGTGEIIPVSVPAKIFLVGSGQMLTDDLLDKEGESPNSTFV
ncbi:MAG: Gldg family protein, partial [Desulfomonilia bacterium]|nr:Gldg family protein [Desulfomonilia bacterium]